MLQGWISSGSGEQVHTSLNQLSDCHRIAILSIEANQSRLSSESEGSDIRRDGPKG
jgi:hypothetical protein